MDAFGPYAYGDSAIGYDMWRRRRSWSMNGPQGLRGYAEFLGGMGGDVGANASGVIAAEISAASDANSWLRPIVIGVATSACAFIVNRWLEKVFK